MTSNNRNRHALVQDMIQLYLDRAWADAEMARLAETSHVN